MWKLFGSKPPIIFSVVLYLLRGYSLWQMTGPLQTKLSAPSWQLWAGAWHWSNSTKHSTPRQLQKWGQSQAAEKRSRESDREYDTIFQGDWKVIGAIEKLSVVFLFVQTSFIIFSMACNQAVKPANWPEKSYPTLSWLWPVTRTRRPGPGEKPPVQCQEGKRTELILGHLHRLPLWQPN